MLYTSEYGVISGRIRAKQKINSHVFCLSQVLLISFSLQMIDIKWLVAVTQGPLARAHTIVYD